MMTRPFLPSLGLVLICLATALAAPAQEDRDAVFFGFRTGPTAHLSAYPDDPTLPVPDGYSRFCNALVNRGISFLVLQVAIEDDGQLQTCVAPDLLGEFGVPPGPVATLRDKVLLARAEKLKIYADISLLARAAHPAPEGAPTGLLTTMDTAALTRLLTLLRDQEGFEGIFADDLPKAWRATVAEFCAAKRIKLMVGDGMSPNEARMVATWVTSDNSFKDIGYGHALNATALGYANFSLAGLTLRSAGATGEGWENPTVLRNVMLFRTLATRSRGAVISSAPDKLPPDFGQPLAEGVPPPFEHVAQLVRQVDRLPVFNILTDLTAEDIGDGITDAGPGKFGYNLVTVASAAVAAGFEPRLSTEPLPDAEVYYLYLKGLEGIRTENSWYEKDTARDFPDALLEQLRKGNKPIFLQVATRLPSSDTPGVSNWTTIRDYFGLNNTKLYRALKADDIPEQGVYNSKWYRHTNADWTRAGRGGEIDPVGPKMQWMTGILKDDIDKEAELLSVGNKAGNQVVLCTRRVYRGGKPNYFVNGSVLDPQAQFLLTNILTENKGMVEPAGYLYVVGQTYTAVLATEKTVANFQLPGRMTAGYAWTAYIPDGTVTRGTERYDPKKGISGLKLDAGTLMILEPKEIR